MQDDYVGLGDLLTLLDEDGYEVEQIAKVDSDSVNELRIFFFLYSNSCDLHRHYQVLKKKKKKNQENKIL
jgi:hypothetical protein